MTTPGSQGAWRGEFRALVSEGAFGGKQTSFYDLFRVENGKIAEHWDAVETIPPREQRKNGNGKFGFHVPWLT
jgi:predicted SnoaL-like aldol condensation-catalyzing enzyme